jgi:WD40 repeat protein
MTDVFVSYSRRDGAFVHGLADELERRGKSVWIDTEGIGDGEVFPEAIRAAIDAADSFVYVITPDAATSRFCTVEVEHAVGVGKRLVPILRSPVPDGELPEAIRVRSWVPFTSDDDAEAAVERLVGALEADHEYIHAHTRWLVKALEWEESGRDGSLLLRGSELAAADRWLAQAGDREQEPPTPLHRDFVYASRSASSRRQRVLVAVSLAVAAISVVLVVFALISRSRANQEAVQARSRVWAANATAQLAVDPERSILLAMAAIRESATPEAVFALQHALDASPLERRLASVKAYDAPLGPKLVYSPDGGLLAEGSQFRVTIVDPRSGRLLRQATVSDGGAVRFNPAGTLLAVAGAGKLALFDPKTGVEPYSTKAGLLGHVAFNRDGSVLYYLDVDKGVFRWRPGHGGPHLVGKAFGAAEPNRTGHRLLVWASILGPNGVSLVDAKSGETRLAALADHYVLDAAFSPDGRTVVVADAGEVTGNGGRIVLLAAHTLKPMRTLGQTVGDSYSGVAFDATGSRVAFGTLLGRVGVYSLATGRLEAEFRGLTNNVSSVAFSPDGQQVATASSDGQTLLWHVPGAATASFDAGGIDVDGSAINYLTELRLTQDRVTARMTPVGGAFAHRQVIQSWGYDGRTTGAPLVVSSLPPPGWPDGVRLSPDGRWAEVVVPSPVSGPTGIQIWDVAGRRIARSFMIKAPAFQTPSFDASRNDLAVATLTGDSGEMFIVDVRSGRERALAKTKCVFGYQHWAFDRAGIHLVTTDACGRLTRMDVSSGHVMASRYFGHIDGLGPLAYSPDGTQLAVANTSNAGALTLLDAVTLEPRVTITGNTQWVTGLVFSPDGRFVLTGSLDGTARLFDAHTGAPLRVLDHPTAVSSVAISPDGRTIGTFDFDGTIRLWPTCQGCQDPKALLAEAARRVPNRQLTDAERATFLP